MLAEYIKHTDAQIIEQAEHVRDGCDDLIHVLKGAK
jgi:hypothetical protein